MTLPTVRNRCFALAMLLAGTLGAQTPLGFDAPMITFGNTDSSMVELLDYDGNGTMESVNVKVQSPYVTVSVKALPAGNQLVSELVYYATPTIGVPLSATGNVGVVDAYGDFAIGDADWVRLYKGGPVVPNPFVSVVFTEASPVQGIAIGDFDGDGLGDVAVLTNTDLRVHRSLSNGSFVLISFPLTPGAAQLVAGDTNHDGVDDLVVVNDACTIFSIVGGALVQGASYVHGISMPMPTIGDVDNDGDADIVVFGMMHYVVIRQTTPGTFVVEAQATGGPATRLYDVDGDGDLDGACCGGGGSPINYINDPSIFRISINQGGGNFAPAFELPGMGSIHIAGVADCNGDGIKDLAAGRCIYFAKAPLTGDPWLPGPGTGPGTRRICDADQDGDPDWNVGVDAVSWNLGNGQSVSAPPVLLTPPAPGTTYSAPGWAGDWDGDGDDDLIVEQVAGSTFLGMILLRNDGGAFTAVGPCFAPDIQLSPYIGSDPGRTIAADVDGDGDLDFVCNSPGPGYWSVVSLNDGNGWFTPTELFQTDVIIAVGDFTGDGLLDYLTSDGRITIRRGLPGGGHGLPQPIATPGTYSFFGLSSFQPLIDTIAVADFNADGRLDFVGAERSNTSPTSAFTRFYLGNPPGYAYPFTATSNVGNLIGCSTVGGGRCFAGDVDGDGVPDLVVKDPSGCFVGGTGVAYARPGNPNIFDSNLTRTFVVTTDALIDVDGDGDADIVGPRIVTARAWEGPSAGRRVQYGTGIPGNGGIIPTLGEIGPFRPGKSCELRIRGGVGGASGLFALGSAPANSPLLGGTLLVTPEMTISIQLGGAPGVPGVGGFTIPFVMPPGIAGGTFFHQAGFVDPAAPSGVSATNGLEIHVGN